MKRLGQALIVLAFVSLMGSRVIADPKPPAIGLQVGQMYPDFVLPDLDGKLGRFSDLRGKKVFLFHFASW